MVRIQTNKLNMHTTKPAQTRSRTISLELSISNGNPRHDTRLRFDFLTNNNHTGQVWMARLPKIKNADAFPRQLGRNQWALSLDALSDTQPMEVITYTPQDAHLWLHGIERRRPPHTELLILAHENHFTVSITNHE